MNPTTPQDERFRGLLDLFIKDQKEREAMRGRAEDFGAAAAMIQPFAIPQPMPLQNTGGLLGQPQTVQMSAPGSGIMSLQSGRDEDESKLTRLMAILGIS